MEMTIVEDYCFNEGGSTYWTVLADGVVYGRFAMLTDAIIYVAVAAHGLIIIEWPNHA